MIVSKLQVRELVFCLLITTANLRNLILKNKIEKWSLQLLEDFSVFEQNKILNDVKVLRNLVLLGRDIYEIEPNTADLIVGRLQDLQDHILQSTRSLQDLQGSIAGILQSDPANHTNSNEEGDSEARQSIILKKISEKNGGFKACQFKDIIESFSDISERTLRYDLQKLFNQGLIDRLGSGPNTWYVPK